jgi:energy-coupling factor transporter ATP-binding protein EcfA2
MDMADAGSADEGHNPMDSEGDAPRGEPEQPTAHGATGWDQAQEYGTDPTQDETSTMEVCQSLRDVRAIVELWHNTVCNKKELAPRIRAALDQLYNDIIVSNDDRAAQRLSEYLHWPGDIRRVVALIRRIFPVSVESQTDTLLNGMRDMLTLLENFAMIMQHPDVGVLPRASTSLDEAPDPNAEGLREVHQHTQVMYDRIVSRISFAWYWMIDTKHMGNIAGMRQPDTVLPAVMSFMNSAVSYANLTQITPAQTIYYGALQKLALLGAKRHRDMVMIPWVVNNVRTTAYKAKCTIESFVHLHMRCPTDVRMLNAMTSSQHVASSVINYLTKNGTAQFPDLRRSRYKIAFRNGTYNIEQNIWEPSARITTDEDRPLTADEENAVRTMADFNNLLNNDQWIRDMSKVNNLLEHLNFELAPENHEAALRAFIAAGVPKDDECACVYHDMDFTWCGGTVHYMEIPTPTMDKIFETQGLHNKDAPDTPPEKELMRWLYALIGRMLFPVGAHDNWEIMLLLLGQAGTGKSTILKLLQMIFEQTDVGIMSNRGEEIFGLETLADTYMCIIFEIRRNWNIDQAVWQSMVSGESVSIPRKGLPALAKVWTAPLAGAANELPRFPDSSGAFSRRIACIEFTEIVEADTSMLRKLKLEMPLILQKCVGAYLDLAGKSTRGFFDICPQYFRDQRDQIRMMTDSLLAFLSKGEIYVHPPGPDPAPDTCRIAQADFIVAYHAFCKQHNMGARDVTNTNQTSSVFAQFKIHVGKTPEIKDCPDQSQPRLAVWMTGCMTYRAREAIFGTVVQDTRGDAYDDM